MCKAGGKQIASGGVLPNLSATRRSAPIACCLGFVFRGGRLNGAVSDEAIVVFDDISWSPGMRGAWSEIEEDKRVVVSVDLGVVGIVLIGDVSARKERYKYRYRK